MSCTELLKPRVCGRVELAIGFVVVIVLINLRGVRVDPEARTPVPWTDAFRAAMAPYQRDPDAA